MRKGETSLQGQTGAIYIATETVAEYTEYINQTDAMQFILPPKQLQSTLLIFADEQFMWRELSHHSTGHLDRGCPLNPLQDTHQEEQPAS